MKKRDPMSDTTPATLSCPRCDKALDFKTHEFIEFGLDADLKEKILKGTLFSAQCPDCGARFLAPFPVLVHVPAMNAMVQYSPLADGEKVEEKAQALTAAIAEQADLFAEFMPGISKKMDLPVRLTMTPVEFFEKVAVLDAGLDDRVLEIMKVLMLQELATDPDWSDVRGFVFSRAKGEETFLAIDASRRAVAQFPFDRDMFDDLAKELTFADNRRVLIDARWAQHVVDVNMSAQ